MSNHTTALVTLIKTINEAGNLSEVKAKAREITTNDIAALVVEASRPVVRHRTFTGTIPRTPTVEWKLRDGLKHKADRYGNRKAPEWKPVSASAYGRDTSEFRKSDFRVQI